MRKRIHAIYSAIFCIGILFFSSCTKMDHFYKDLIVERVYIGKPDSIWVQSGENRVKINFVPPRDAEVKDLIVRWDGGRDSVVVPMNYGSDYQSFIIDNLEERDYMFDAYTTDRKGKRSLPLEMSTPVFGAHFRSTIEKRPFSHSVVFPDSIALLWENMASETLYGVEIDFTDKNGQKQKTFSRSSSAVSVFLDADPNKPVAVKTVFRAHPNAFEYFYTEPVNIDLVATKRNKLTLVSSAYQNAEYIDFKYVRAFLQAEVPRPVGSDVDMAYTLGGSSKSNLFTMDGAGFSAFNADWQLAINQWPVRNSARLKLNRGAAALALYDGLDEMNRSQMVAAYDNSAVAAQDRVFNLLVGDVILLKSTTRNIYVAMKVLAVPPATANTYGKLEMELKISRP